MIENKSKTPIWPVIALFISLLVCIPLFLFVGMGIGVSGGNFLSYLIFYASLGIPIILAGIAIYTYIKNLNQTIKTKEKSSFNAKFYLILILFLILSPVILFFLWKTIIRLIKRIIFFLSFSAPNNSFIFYILIPFLLFMILAYGIASIFENEKRVVGIIITCIILGILIFAIVDEKAERIKYNCFSEQSCFLKLIESKNDVTKCTLWSCVTKYLDENKLTTPDCLVLKGELYIQCLQKSAILNGDFNACFLLKEYNYGSALLDCLPNVVFTLEDCKLLDDAPVGATPDHVYNNVYYNSYDNCVSIFARKHGTVNDCLIIYNAQSRYSCFRLKGEKPDCSMFINDPYYDFCVRNNRN